MKIWVIHYQLVSHYENMKMVYHAVLIEFGHFSEHAYFDARSFGKIHQTCLFSWQPNSGYIDNIKMENVLLTLLMSNFWNKMECFQHALLNPTHKS